MLFVSNPKYIPCILVPNTSSFPDTSFCKYFIFPVSSIDVLSTTIWPVPCVYSWFVKSDRIYFEYPASSVSVAEFTTTEYPCVYFKDLLL